MWVSEIDKNTLLPPSSLVFSPSSVIFLLCPSCLVFCSPPLLLSHLPLLSCSPLLFSSLVFSPSFLFPPTCPSSSPIFYFVLSPGHPFFTNILHKKLNVNIPEHGSVEIFYVNLEQTSTIFIRKHSFILLFCYLFLIHFKYILLFCSDLF